MLVVMHALREAEVLGVEGGRAVAVADGEGDVVEGHQLSRRRRMLWAAAVVDAELRIQVVDVGRDREEREDRSVSEKGHLPMHSDTTPIQELRPR